MNTLRLALGFLVGVVTGVGIGALSLLAGFVAILHMHDPAAVALVLVSAALLSLGVAASLGKILESPLLVRTMVSGTVLATVLTIGCIFLFLRTFPPEVIVGGTVLAALLAIGGALYFLRVIPRFLS